MRYRVIAASCVLIIVTLSFATAGAQSGFVAAYFDQNLSQVDHPNPCPGIGVPDKVYFAAVGWDLWITGVQFKATYPTSLLFVSDTYTGNIAFGNTASGLAMSWSLPQNAYEKVLIATSDVIWNCNSCSGKGDHKVEIGDHPNLGPVAVSDNEQLYPGSGLSGLVCSAIPVEKTTWGGIKALYSTR